jgi:hypothetical protein
MMMSTCARKHVEARNKYIKKECVKLVINQNYVKMHGQQNIKNIDGTLISKAIFWKEVYRFLRGVRIKLARNG